MHSPGACALQVGIYFRVSIYFSGRYLLYGKAYALIWHDLKKNPGPSMYSPGRLLLSGQAFTFRVGIYFFGRHVLLFGII